MPKPNDFFLGLYEFFSILLPGALLIFLFKINIADSISSCTSLTSQEWAVFLLLSYIVGHLLQIPANLIDKYIYNSLYVEGWKRPSLPRNYDKDRINFKAMWRRARVFRLLDRFMKWAALPSTQQTRSWQREWRKNWIKGIRKAHQLLAHARILVRNRDIGNVYDLSYAIVKISSTDAIIEIDRLQADSKLFRSLGVVFLVAAIARFSVTLNDPINSIAWIMLYVILIIASLYRYSYLRWKATQWLYQYFIILAEMRAAQPVNRLG